MARKFFSCVASFFFSKTKNWKFVGNWVYVNYLIFHNLKNRPPRKLFHNAWLDLRNTSIENRLFLSFRNLRFVLMFWKTSNVSLLTRRHFNWIAPRHLENPLFEIDKRKLEETSLSLRNLMGASELAFLRDYVDPVGKRLGADFLEFVATETAKVVSAR